MLLVVLRAIQGIGVGGEWAGSVLLAMEWGSVRRRGLMASWPQLGVPLGLLLSTGMVKLMSATTGASFATWGWRIPFLASAILVVIGLYVRLKVAESPEFTQLKHDRMVVRQPVWQVIRQHPREILASAFLRMSEQAPFYLFITFVLSYGTTVLHLARDGLLNDTLIAAAIGLVSVPFFGLLSDLIGRRVMYGIGIVATAVVAFPYFGLLNTRSAGLGYQLASVIAGGPAPLIATAILAATGSSTYISWYIIGCAALSMTALLLRDPPDHSNPNELPLPRRPPTIHSPVAEFDNSAVERPPSCYVVELGALRASGS